MELPQWYLIIGALLALIAYLQHVIARSPVSVAMIYLAVGLVLGPLGANALVLDPLRDRELIELLAEIAVLISLFTAGVKLRVPLNSIRWRVPIRLATLTMIYTIALFTLVGWYALALPLGAAVLLAAILAPTDPVLAAEVQLRDPEDRDQLRFSLTGEGAMNDGTAFPFVFLGLGLLGLHEIGDWGLTWALRDLLWGTLGGLAIGFAVGHAVAWSAHRLRELRSEAVRLNEFLLLAVIALSYGAALMVHALGFLAVFAAGIAMQRFDQERVAAAEQGGQPREAIAPRVLQINEQLERIAEVGLVLLVGAMISAGHWSWTGVGLAAVLILVVRPIAVYLSLVRVPVDRTQRRLVAWFGIRGIGSLYYVAFAAGKGLDPALAELLFSAVFTVIASSVIVHGVSATPLMNVYERYRRRRRRSASMPP